MKKLLNKNLLILSAIYILSVPILAVNFSTRPQYHFITLADAFAKGHLSIEHLPYKNDFASFHGHYYSPLGPFPAITVLPFWITLKSYSLENMIKILLTALNFILIFRISKRLTSDDTKSWLLSIFYVFGSVLTPIETYSFSNYYSQVVYTILLLYSIWEFLGKRRYFLIGTALGFSFLTRADTILAFIFFLPAIISKPKLKEIIYMTAPILFSIFVFLLYNYLRFGNPLEQGYNYLFIQPFLKSRFAAGSFSIKHIPENLYTMLFKPPLFQIRFPYIFPDPLGMSLFILSPMLLLLFKINFHEKFVKESLIVSFCILLPILFYYGIGYKQIGYRYALDFFPFILIILAQISKRTSLQVLAAYVTLSVITTFTFTFIPILFYFRLPNIF